MILVVFHLDEQRYALHLSAVERVVRVAEIVALPQAPAIVAGIINVRGVIVPIVDVRQRFRLAKRDVTLGDHLIIARTTRRAVGFVVDEASEVLESADADVTAAHEVFPAMELVAGVLKRTDGLILIHDLDAFLSPMEEKCLTEAMSAA
jgi:purine-binding chemotaxis protein CheW